MPVITVWNSGIDRMVDGWRQGLGSEFIRILKEAVISVPELKDTSKDDIAVFLPSGYADPPNLMLVSVDILFDAPERTREVREKLAKRLLHAARTAFSDFPRKIEVVVRAPFDTTRDVYLTADVITP